MAGQSRLYEWIIGAGLIAVLAALTIPAILAAREAARVKSCENNLKQLSLGLLNYSDIYQVLPPGTSGNRELPPTERFSWHPPFRHFVEGKPPRLLVDDTLAWNAEVNRFPMVEYTIDLGWPTERNEIVPLRPYQLLVCPSAGPSEPIFGISLTQYIGLAGLGSLAPEVDSGQPSIGIWGYDRQTKLADFADSSSSTISLIETNVRNGPWLAGGPPTVRGIDPSAPPYLGPSRQFGGLHSNCLAAMVDGSVRQLSNETDSRIVEAMATISGTD